MSTNLEYAKNECTTGHRTLAYLLELNQCFPKKNQERKYVIVGILKWRLKMRNEEPFIFALCL